MIDGYELMYGDSDQECDRNLIKGTSSWIRWIPETIAECDSLECMNCRKALVNCAFVGRSHTNCPHRDSLPKTTEKQSSILDY
jgi:hypothetical protein